MARKWGHFPEAFEPGASTARIGTKNRGSIEEPADRNSDSVVPREIRLVSHQVVLSIQLIRAEVRFLLRTMF